MYVPEIIELFSKQKAPMADTNVAENEAFLPSADERETFLEKAHDDRQRANRHPR